MSTVKGARTGFFYADLERLYIAVWRQGSTPAMIHSFGVSWPSRMNRGGFKEW